ncbi:MAG: MOSC domain-containing protein, partial [Spirosomaceae bacterium]|nr:MOSC domain-containing protein [Spirosomataceae bacterium]
EDVVKNFTVNNVKLCGVKPCARCVMTTIKPGTTEKGTEPLKTLSTYRKVGNKILFGQNVLVHKTGEVSVGNEIELI